MTPVAKPDPQGVFINCPFDPTYEPLFVTLVGTLVFLGQKPHCVLEVRERGDGRLIRIVEFMQKCRMSIHDLSHVGAPARFNMPFELGLAYSLKLSRPSVYEVFVLDSIDYRLDRTLSDYKGRDPLIHDSTCDGLIASLLDVFETRIDDALTEVARAARLLRKSAKVMKRSQRSPTIFRPSLFRLVVAAATDIAVDRAFITP